MTDCPYCPESFADESAIREHLHEAHDYDELSRIDARRVDQYVAEHDLGANDDEPTRADDDEPTPDQQRPDDPGVTEVGGNRNWSEHWEMRDVEAMSTAEITETLAEHGIDTTEAAFCDRAADLESATDLADQWDADYDVTATGHDRDFIWMAAEVLWKRWAPDLPNRERIYELILDGRDRKESGDAAEACQRWLRAWEFIVAVTPEDATSVAAADDHLPTAVALEPFLRSLDSDLAALAADDPAYHERRLEFCREVCSRFPDADDELRLDFRHFVADSLRELGRLADSRDELEALVDEYPEDPYAYKKLADSYWVDGPDEPPVEEMERAAELYRQALDADRPLEGASIVRDRLDEIERRLTEGDTTETDE